LVKPSDLIVLATVVAGAGAAAAIDLRTRRVPNALTLLLASSGVLFAVSGITGVTLGASLAGLALGLALMLPGHVLGATGAGDVKLFAAVGAVIGPAPIVAAFVYTALAGGLTAVAVAIRRRRLRQTLGLTARVITSAASQRADIESPLENNRFPYAPAIAVGSIIAVLGL
jgi:prepilin peptidase CpaA